MLEDRMRKLGFGLLVHDVGKLAVPNEILNKPGRLTGEEMDAAGGIGELIVEMAPRDAAA